MSKKKFLLLCPATFHLYELIVKNLAYLGYDVTHIEHEGYGFTYKSFWERVYNFIRKVFLGDRTYKLTLRNQYISYRQWEIFNANLPFDYALVIRPDLFDKQFIEAIGNQSKLMIGFQFDGVSRNPEVLDYRPLFSQFYVFDPSDVETYPNHNFSYSPNFYFDYPDADLYSESDPYSVYYVSTYHKSRIEDLIIVHTALSKHYEKIKFCVLIPPENVQFLPEYVLQHMQVMHKMETYEEHLKQVANSEIIVDLVIAEHNGFSFRIMEGIKFGKKVITTNAKIKEAEFYHPHNFYVLNKDNLRGLTEFISKPYVPMDSAMRLKYGFSAWLESKIKG